jgi:transposase
MLRHATASKARRRPPVRKSIPSKVATSQHSIGLDIGYEKSELCVLDRKGQVMSRQSIDTTPESIRSFFTTEPNVVVLEASGVSGWIARLLEELGHQVLVCNPRRLRMIAETTMKTDALDAHVLAMLARLAQVTPDMVHPVTVRSREAQLDRMLLAQRDQLVKQRTASISFIKSLLRSDALPMPPADVEAFGSRVTEMNLPEDVRRLITPMLDVLRTVNDAIKQLEQQIGELHEKLPITKAFREIDGVGKLVSIAFALTIDDPDRFARARDVGPYLGLIPTLRKSSTIERRGATTKQGDQRMRRYLAQAAIVLMRSKKTSALQQWGLALESRVGKKKARVAVARKLAVTMLAMWKNGTPYERFPNWEVKTAA